MTSHGKDPPKPEHIIQHLDLLDKELSAVQEQSPVCAAEMLALRGRVQEVRMMFQPSEGPDGGDEPPGGLSPAVKRAVLGCLLSELAHMLIEWWGNLSRKQPLTRIVIDTWGILGEQHSRHRSYLAEASDPGWLPAERVRPAA